MKAVAVNHFKNFLSVRDDWNDMIDRLSPDHPFMAFDWLKLWYEAYCPADKVRLLLIYDDGVLVAAFPGYETSVAVRKISLRCLSLAANGHTPIGDIPVVGRVEPIYKELLKLIPTAFNQCYPLVVLPKIAQGSTLYRVLKTENDLKKNIRIENQDITALVTTYSGWDKYYESKKSKTRTRIKSYMKKISDLGELEYSFINYRDMDKQFIERIQRLDQSTWQGQQKSSLFTDPLNLLFYSSLMNCPVDGYEPVFCLTTINQVDASFALAMMKGEKAFTLKIGYDQKFSKYGVGVLTNIAIYRYLSDRGVHINDVGAGIDDEKRRWATAYYPCVNFWYFNKKTLLGRALCRVSGFYDRYKRTGTDHD